MISKSSFQVEVCVFACKCFDTDRQHCPQRYQLFKKRSTSCDNQFCSCPGCATEVLPLQQKTGVAQAMQGRCCPSQQIHVDIYTSISGELSRLRKRGVVFHSPLHIQDHFSGNIQNSIRVIELRVFALLLKCCSQIAQAFVGVCPKVYKLAASKKTNNKDHLSKTNVCHVL